MKNSAKPTVVYTTKAGTLGYRSQVFAEWVEGEKIKTADGSETCIIVRVVETTEENLEKLSTLLKYMAKLDKGVVKKKTVEIAEGLKIQVPVSVRKWVSDEARLETFHAGLVQLFDTQEA